MSESPVLPDDSFHAHLYVWLTTSETACTQCNVQPDLHWAWDGVPAGEAGAVVFAMRAVKSLKAAGWQMNDGMLFCPECSAKLLPKISD